MNWFSKLLYEFYRSIKPRNTPQTLSRKVNKENYMEQEKGVKDEYLEHNAYHQSFHADCSTCYSERRLINAHRTVNRKILGSNIKSNYPEGINRFNPPWND